MKTENENLKRHNFLNESLIRELTKIKDNFEKDERPKTRENLKSQYEEREKVFHIRNFKIYLYFIEICFRNQRIKANKRTNSNRKKQIDPKI